MPPRFHVLISAPYLQPVLDRYRPRLEAAGCALRVPPVQERLEEAELLPMVGEIDGALCGDDRFSARVIDAAPRLKVISKWGTGVDSIDRDACARRGIVVHNVPGAFSDAVADSALGYALCFARQLPFHAAAMRAGGWQKRPARSLRELTVGVVGIGAVGRAFIERLRPFGARILGCDPRAPDLDWLRAHPIELVDVDALIARSDIVSLHCDLNPTSRHLMDSARLAAMKPGAILINTARGPIVDEAALVAALRRGTLAGAALDVFEQEPLPADSPLRALEQVMLSPHNTNASPAAYEHVHQRAIDNLLSTLLADG